MGLGALVMIYYLLYRVLLWIQLVSMLVVGVGGIDCGLAYVAIRKQRMIICCIGINLIDR